MPHRPCGLRATCFSVLCLCVVTFATSRGIRAQETGAETVIDFENEVQPILTRFGCNSGPCHGKARGQGGFQLSLFGFDVQQDFDAIVKEGRGRRIFAGSPTESLLLSKPTAKVAHGGGKRLDAGSPEYQTILKWIEQGLPRKATNAPSVKSIAIEPAAVTLAPGQSIDAKITATYSDGTQRDVTRLAQFQSNEAPIASVDEAGRITPDKSQATHHHGEVHGHDRT